MNRINPLYTVIFLLLILVYSIIKLQDAKKELVLEKNLYEKNLKLALQTSALKKAFANKERQKRAILRILSSPVLKNANIKKQITNSGIQISAKAMNRTALNFLMGKILNTTFNITKLKIKRINPKSADLKVAIKW